MGPGPPRLIILPCRLGTPSHSYARITFQFVPFLRLFTIYTSMSSVCHFVIVSLSLSGRVLRPAVVACTRTNALEYKGGWQTFRRDSLDRQWAFDRDPHKESNLAARPVTVHMRRFLAFATAHGHLLDIKETSFALPSLQPKPITTFCYCATLRQAL